MQPSETATTTANEIVTALENYTEKIRSEITQSEDPLWIARKVNEHVFGGGGLFSYLPRQVGMLLDAALNEVEQRGSST